MSNSCTVSNCEFARSLVTLTIAPAFIAGSIYLCLARIIVVFGANLSRFAPRTYTITFVTCDFISLLLQAAGGAIASSANTASSNQLGVNIMIAGLSFQVASLLLFILLCAEFGWRVRQHPHETDPRFASVRSTKMFKAFLISKCMCIPDLQSLTLPSSAYCSLSNLHPLLLPRRRAFWWIPRQARE